MTAETITTKQGAFEVLEADVMTSRPNTRRAMDAKGIREQLVLRKIGGQVLFVAHRYQNGEVKDIIRVGR